MQKNKINIIFLDVDGVLNSRAYLNNHKDPEDEIDMRAVERLAKIYRQCNCKQAMQLQNCIVFFLERALRR